MRRVIMLAAAVVMAMSAPAAANPLEGDWILLHFQDQPGAVYDLYLVHPDGTGLVNLTNGVADDYTGVVSPDGSLIAMSSNDGTSTEIWVMDFDGADRQRLTSSGGYGVAWTPDGRIVYSRSTEIRIMAADGSGDALVVDGLANVAHNLSVSPDGSTVAFDVQVEADRDIYSVPLAGGIVSELTTEGGFEPEWSPDGTQIVFTTFRAFGGNFWVMNPDGTDQHNLFPSEFNDFEASWSPDGTQIVFESVRNEDFAISIFDLTAGTSVDVLTRPTAATFRSPVWVRITSSGAPPVTPTTAGAATTTVASASSTVDGAASTTVAGATTTLPAGDGEESSIDPIWVALFGTVVAAAAIGIVLARQSGKGKEPPPPPAAPES